MCTFKIIPVLCCFTYLIFLQGQFYYTKLNVFNTDFIFYIKQIALVFSGFTANT